MKASSVEDAALAMAMGHVALNEFYFKQRSPYFDDYARRYTDLPLLARQFRAAGKLYAKEQQAARLQAPGQHPGPAQDWAGDTSGFGLSRPLPVAGAAPHRADDEGEAKPSWFSPSRWLGG